MRKVVRRIVFIAFAIEGIAGTFQALFSKGYVNPAIPLYILITVCAIGFLVLADKK